MGRRVPEVGLVRGIRRFLNISGLLTFCKYLRVQLARNYTKDPKEYFLATNVTVVAHVVLGGGGGGGGNGRTYNGEIRETGRQFEENPKRKHKSSCTVYKIKVVYKYYPNAITGWTLQPTAERNHRVFTMAKRRRLLVC